MAEWGFWEWLTYGCIGIAALMLALDAAVKQSPDLNARFGHVLATRLWAFTPFALILMSAIVIAVQHLERPANRVPAAAPVVAGNSGNAVTGPTPAPIPDHVATGKPGKRIFVGFGPTYLMEMSKKNTAAESEAILKLYAGKWIKVDNEKLSVAIRNTEETTSLTHDPYVLISVKLTTDYVVMCRLSDKSQMETAMTTRPDSPVSFEGAIYPQQTMLGAILLLDPCELK